MANRGCVGGDDNSGEERMKEIIVKERKGKKSIAPLESHFKIC